MDRVCRQGDGLFPSPKEIKLSCSCPDWADMCKHVAAALYGVGARLDRQPELLFTLRGVDAQDMIAKAGAHLAAPAPGAASNKVLLDDDVAALFGLDMAEERVAAPADPGPAALPKRGQSERATKRMLAKAVGSKREKGGQGPAALGDKRTTVQGTATLGANAGKRGANGDAMSAKQKPGRREPLHEAITTPASRPKSKAKSPAGRPTTKARARIEALIEEATVDAYTEAEQAVGHYTMICEHLALPFKSKVLGREVDVVRDRDGRR